MVKYNNSTNDYSTSSFIVDSTAGKGNYTTIASAITAAGAGPATIFIRPGTYIEDLILQPNVNLTAFPSDWSNTVIIKGKSTFTQAGNVVISGIQLQTNSDYALAITGSDASNVYLYDCYINCLNNTGISFTSSSSSSNLVVEESTSNLATTGIALLVSTSAGQSFFIGCNLNNSGASTTPSSGSAAQIYLQNTSGSILFSTTSTGNVTVLNCNFNTGLSINGTFLTTAGTGSSSIYNSNIDSGTASSVSVGSGTTVILANDVLKSSNTNVITGAGTAQYSGCTFPNSTGINVTSQTGSGPIAGLKNTVSVNTPTAGYIGEQIRAISSSFSVSSNTTTNVTSISVTAGVWDISGLSNFNASGTNSQNRLSINSVSSTEGSVGDNETYGTTGTAGVSLGMATIPSWRFTTNANTTVYLIVFSAFSSGTMSVSGRISATRVG